MSYNSIKNIILSLLLISNISIANKIENKKDKILTYSLSINNFYYNGNYLMNYNNFYSEGYDIGSMLSWKIKDVLMLDNDFQIKITPKTSINLNGYIGLTKGDGLFKDYDTVHYPKIIADKLESFFDREKKLSITQRESNSKDWNMVSYSKVKLKSLKGFDLNLQQNLFDKNNFLVNILLGFKLDNYNWYAYNTYGNRFNELFYYYNGIGINYKEIYKTPYIGLNFNYNYHKWNVNLITKYSSWASYRATDFHLNYDKFYNMKNKNSIDYYGINLKINYKIKENIDIFLNYSWNKYSRFSILQNIYTESKLVESYENNKSLYNKHWTKNINRNIGVGLNFRF